MLVVSKATFCRSVNPKKCKVYNISKGQESNEINIRTLVSIIHIN